MGHLFLESIWSYIRLVEVSRGLKVTMHTFLRCVHINFSSIYVILGDFSRLSPKMSIFDAFLTKKSIFLGFLDLKKITLDYSFSFQVMYKPFQAHWMTPKKSIFQNGWPKMTKIG